MSVKRMWLNLYRFIIREIAVHTHTQWCSLCITDQTMKRTEKESKKVKRKHTG